MLQKLWSTTLNKRQERFHRSLKASLRARLHDGNWIDELPWVLLGLRTATKEDLQTSPAEMVFGDSPLLPGEFASSGKTPFFPSFTQTSTTSPQKTFEQHHMIRCVLCSVKVVLRYCNINSYFRLI